MIRIIRGNIRMKKRKKFFKFCKGFKQLKTYIYNKEQTFQSLFTQYIGRRLKKRNLKLYQILLLNSVIQQLTTKISNFFDNLRKYRIFITKQVICVLSYAKYDILIFLTKLM